MEGKNKQKKYNTLMRIIFSIIGLLSLAHIIRSYGVQRIIEEIQVGPWGILILALSFLPTLLCYSLSWLLITDDSVWRGRTAFWYKWFLFTKFSIISIAWNNLTPFLKIGGEALKYFLLLDHLPKRESIASAINYNLIHLFATALSFFFGAMAVLLFYDTASWIKHGIGLFLVVLGIILILVPVSYKLIRKMWLKQNLIDKGRGKRIFFYALLVSLRRFFNLLRERPLVFWSSVLIDFLARFVEGLTFYISFELLSNYVDIFICSILNVGRTFLDTIFFFIPYQMGTREEGMRYLMETIFNIDSKGFLTAVLLYRLVEILWIIIGYLFWIISKKAGREARQALA